MFPQRRGAAERAADQRRLPPQHPERDREQGERARDRDLADAADAGRQLEADEQRDHAGRNHRGGRQRVEHVLDRERGQAAGASATRPRTNAAFAGSPTSGPSGVRLPIASPQMTAAKASLEAQAVRRIEAQPPRDARAAGTGDRRWR